MDKISLFNSLVIFNNFVITLYLNGSEVLNCCRLLQTIFKIFLKSSNNGSLYSADFGGVLVT